MRPNPQNHLDDLAKRFAATSATSRPTTDDSDEFADTSARSPAGSDRATRLGIAVLLAALMAAAVVGLLLMRR